MDLEFDDEDLDRLEVEPRFTAGFSQAAVRGYRKVIQSVRAAKDTRDLYATKGLRMERLQGKRQHQHSLRVNDQWRLVIEIIDVGSSKKILVVELVDCH